MIPAVRHWIAECALEYVEGRYQSWRARGGFPGEPRITIAEVTDYLDQCGHPDDFRFASRRQRYAAVRTQLARLVREGKLGVSIGTSPDTRREARLYEPAKS